MQEWFALHIVDNYVEMCKTLTLRIVGGNMWDFFVRNANVEVNPHPLLSGYLGVWPKNFRDK